MPRFNLGERVILSKSGIDMFGYQSEGHTGVILEVYDDNRIFCYKVKWDNGHENSYREEDVSLHTLFDPNKSSQDYLVGMWFLYQGKKVYMHNLCLGMAGHETIPITYDNYASYVCDEEGNKDLANWNELTPIPDKPIDIYYYCFEGVEDELRGTKKELEKELDRIIIEKGDSVNYSVAYDDAWRQRQIDKIKNTSSQQLFKGV